MPPPRRWCAMLVPRQRREGCQKGWKGCNDGKSRGRRCARGACCAISGKHAGRGARALRAPWHVRALHQGAFGFRRRRHDCRQRVEPHRAGARGGRGRCGALVAARGRGLSRRHVPASGHRPLHTPSARRLRRTGRPGLHAEEAHDDAGGAGHPQPARGHGRGRGARGLSGGRPHHHPGLGDGAFRRHRHSERAGRRHRVAALGH